MGLSTHVLNQTSGQPAAGLSVTLYYGDEQLSQHVTDADGRCTDLLRDRPLMAGDYRLVFTVGDYFAAQNLEAFYGDIPIDFRVTDTDRHYHVPLLLSPYGYATYRGS